MAHRCSPPFAQVAEQDGKIVDVDEKLQMVEIQYGDGSRHSFKIGENYAANISGGFHTDQSMMLNGFKEGQKFKKDDVLFYNPKFFEPEAGTKQVIYKLGLTASVALAEEDLTLDDSSFITKELSEKLAFHPTLTRDISIDCSTTIHEIVSIGDEVSSKTPLLIFDESKMSSGVADQELAELLKNLNRAAPKAKHAGKIVKIECFYQCAHERMSPTVLKVVKKAEHGANQQAAFASHTNNAYKFPKPSNTKMGKLNRVGTAYLTPDNVIIRFYISHKSNLEIGSKIIYDSSLKSVVGMVLDDTIVAEDGVTKVDAVMGWRALQARIILSPLLCGVSAAILEALEKQVKEKFFT